MLSPKSLGDTGKPIVKTGYLILWRKSEKFYYKNYREKEICHPHLFFKVCSHMHICREGKNIALLQVMRVGFYMVFVHFPVFICSFTSTPTFCNKQFSKYRKLLFKIKSLEMVKFGDLLEFEIYQIFLKLQLRVANIL